MFLGYTGVVVVPGGELPIRVVRKKGTRFLDQQVVGSDHLLVRPMAVERLRNRRIVPRHPRRRAGRHRVREVLLTHRTEPN